MNGGDSGKFPADDAQSPLSDTNQALVKSSRQCRVALLLRRVSDTNPHAQSDKVGPEVFKPDRTDYSEILDERKTYVPKIKSAISAAKLTHRPGRPETVTETLSLTALVRPLPE